VLLLLLLLLICLTLSFQFWTGQKDIEKYKADCAERRRKSLQYRGKHTRMNRLQEEERRIAQLQKQEADSRLQSLAQKDVEEYYKDCKRRRRKSLALRAKERRQHVEWKRKKQQETVQNNAHTSYLNSLDIQHMALAKEQERARRALDALRGAGFKIKGNPFGDLLKDL
jgi:regulatory protein YycH of two-component signal transduction system YycFG